LEDGTQAEERGFVALVVEHGGLPEGVGTLHVDRKESFSACDASTPPQRGNQVFSFARGTQNENTGVVLQRIVNDDLPFLFPFVEVNQQEKMSVGNVIQLEGFNQLQSFAPSAGDMANVDFPLKVLGKFAVETGGDLPPFVVFWENLEVPFVSIRSHGWTSPSRRA
jgi:hypothetical protein